MRARKPLESPLKNRAKSIRRSILADKPRDVIASLPSASVVTAVVEEEPLPIVMAEMTLWGVAASVMMVPLGLIAMAASPLVGVWNMLQPAAQPLAVK